nr:MAG TPA: hypothetical protein [Caudoviricetes sp.]
MTNIILGGIFNSTSRDNATKERSEVHDQH